MINQPTPALPMTQKAERKAIAATANDRAVFQATKFGRLRIPSLPVRVVVGVIALLVMPFVFVYRCARGTQRLS